MTSKQFSELSSLLDSNRYKIIRITDMISEEAFKDFFSLLICHYTHNGNNTYLKGRILFKNLIKEINETGSNKYIWMNLLELEKFNKICKIMNPIKTYRDLRSSKLYLGDKGTGAHLHYHPLVINFLVSGRKLWIMFPHNEHNTNCFKKIGFKKGKYIEEDVVEWTLKHREIFENEIEGLEIAFQEAGTVFYLPDNIYHIVINLEVSMGITFSWY